MTINAKYTPNKRLKNKKIVLSGAMIPYAFGSSSDGFFNLGCTLSLVQTSQPGVYITMQGEYFHWNGEKRI